MYITNSDEVIPILRSRLRDYLILKKAIEPHQTKLLCPFHDDSDPSMALNPKNGFETAHCFTCGESMDIFRAAAAYENLAETGAEWMTETIPALAAQLSVSVTQGEPSPVDREKAKLRKLAQDIHDIISNPTYVNTTYVEDRGWTNEFETCGSIAEDTLMSLLIEKGWTATELNTSLMIRTSKTSFFGADKVTFTIKDHRGRPIAFQSRNLTETGPKYVNTHESSIYEKRRTLMGIDLALKSAKHNGLYVVEGPGDRAQMLRVGIKNVAALCGSALTADHFALLRSLGIRTIFLCLDWDKAGFLAISRIFEQALRNNVGVSCWVVEPPGEDINTDADGELLTDADEFLKFHDDYTIFDKLEKTSAFEWVLSNISDNISVDQICARMVPIIASETAAVRRELLIKSLSDRTGVSYHSILTDVATLRDGKLAERRERLLGAVQQYQQDVEREPDNLASIMAGHEQSIRRIEADYERDIIGVNYQLSRYDALQEMKAGGEDGADAAVFKMGYFSQFAEVMSGGMIWTRGCLMYVGGRANSGKTATVILIGIDVALNDPDAIVVMHFTDDSYSQIEPRFLTNVARMLNTGGGANLKIGQAASPRHNIHKAEDMAVYNQAEQVVRQLIADERLVIIDAEDGSTLSALERTLRYVRHGNPQKKIMVVCDNTHNYMDFTHMDQTSRMTMIANSQKSLTARYRCCMIATAEYRKNMPFDRSKLKMPVDDDLADARALMYRPNIIFHVYNDLHDRGEEHAEMFWQDAFDPEVKLPRLALVFSKNKITSFKDKLYLDLHPGTVTLQQKAKDEAKKEWLKFQETGASSGGEAVVEANEW